MAKRKSKNLPVALVGSYPEPVAHELRKESRWSNRAQHEPGTVPAGMRFAYGPDRNVAYGESRGIERPAKRFRGMRKSLGD